MTPLTKRNHKRFKTKKKINFEKLFQKFQRLPAESIENAGDWFGIKLEDISVCCDEVFKALSALKDNTAPGPDGIPAYFWKYCASSLTFPITALFDMSLKSGIFPASWKESFVIPLLKSGDSSNVRNYRPICKSSALAQLFDSIMYSKLSPIFQNLINSIQHGFLSGKCTLTNLLSLNEDAFHAFSNKHQLDAIYTDFSKAFDKLNHDALIYKLKCAGIHGSLLRWFISYLRNRTQIVLLRNSKSKGFHVKSGVPQGSHLGPLLFILFLSDLHLYLDPRIKVLLFADDCKIYYEITTIQDCLFLQQNLERFTEYCSKFLLELNLEKCNKISFSRISTSIKFDYKLNGATLREVSEIKDLGVLLDSKLKFGSHIEHIYNKALKMLGYLIRTCRDFRNVNAIKTVYYAYVRSHLEYCSQIWNPSQSNHTQLLEKIQRKFTRFLFNKGLLCSSITEFHYLPILQHLNFRSLSSRRDCSDLILLLKIASGRFRDIHLAEYIRTPSTIRELRNSRSLISLINRPSTLNRCVEKFNNHELDYNTFLNNSYSSNLSIIFSAIPLF